MIRTLLIVIFSSQLLIAQNFNDLFFGTDTTLDVISWNIESFPKHSNTALRVQEILLNLDADVYALQEIYDTVALKQLVGNMSEYECYFNKNYNGGLAYIYNINSLQINAEYEIFTSQQYWNALPRSPQILDCTFHGENFIIINNHFKCCGDGSLNINDYTDEENRRLQATTLLKQYIDSTLANRNVILLGDLNDELIDNNLDNVFRDLLIDSTNYLFVDMQIAQGSSINWSYPRWPSHLDHILITNELFSNLKDTSSFSSVIRIDDYMNSWNDYEYYISDHRPVGLQLNFNIVSSINESISRDKILIKVVDALGKEIQKGFKGLIFKLYKDGTVEKNIIIE